MKIAYTVCTLNRLGQISVLGKSLLKYNPDYTFIIGLADELNGRIDSADYSPFVFISLSEMNDPKQKALTDQYDPFELSCALKAYYGDFILKKYNPGILFYFDTDICIYDSLNFLEKSLNEFSILITPHYSSPLPADGKYPRERDVLNSGLYNGGFIGLKNDDNAVEFISWWKERLSDQGYNNVCEGMMVDQLWLNLVPLFFKQVLILEHPGCNIAYWNMYERQLVKQENNYLVNNLPLIFFHFSGYRLENPGKISIHQNRFSLSDNSALKELIAAYHRSLEENKFNEHLSLESVYGKKHRVKQHSFLKKKAMNFLGSFGYKLEKIRKM